VPEGQFVAPQAALEIRVASSSGLTRVLGECRQPLHHVVDDIPASLLSWRMLLAGRAISCEAGQFCVGIEAPGLSHCLDLRWSIVGSAATILATRRS